MEVAMNSSKVTLFCEECGKATGISHKLLEDGARVRICKKYGEAFWDLEGGTLHEWTLRKI